MKKIEMLPDQTEELLRAIAPHPPLERDIGTAYYTLLIYHTDRHDSVLITITTDREWVRYVTYNYHDRLSGATEQLRFPNPGNGDRRCERFAFLCISDLLTRTNRSNPSPSDADDYYLTLKNFIVYRLLELIRIAGSQVSPFPAVYHFSVDFELLERYALRFLRREIPREVRRAGGLDLTWR